ncbi:MAG: gliding motility protein GldM [Flavisolibacter sp.]
MALPKEPRQKMINLMYLVLTAMLALNVSAEILNAFKTVNNSLQTTNKTINTSTETIITSLKDKMTDPTTAVKAEIWYPKAQRAQDLTKEVYSFIQHLKDTILKESGFNPNKANGFDSTFKQDNLDIATRILVEGPKGKELQKKLEAYKAQLLSIDPVIAQQFQNSLQVDLTMPKVQDKSNKTWEGAYFHMVPTVAALTMLSKFQNDVKTSENRVVAYCHEQVGKVIVRFDSYTAIMGQNSTYLMPGQDLEVMAGVGAFSKAALPVITINGQGAPLDADGAAHIKVPGGGVGQHSVPVHIVYKDQEGKMQTIDKKIDYTVGQANASIALDKMNVLYIGVDNPVTVAASGGGDDKIKASISSGSLSKAGGTGKWIARVNNITDDCKITVSVDGKVAGISQFRVRTIPAASATVGGYQSGANINAGAFIAQAGVGAGIKDFPFELSYKVTSFTVSCDNDEGDIDPVDVVGNFWSNKAQAMLRKDVKPGRLVTLDNIKVLGPDGRTTTAPSLVYYIK